MDAEYPTPLYIGLCPNVKCFNATNDWDKDQIQHEIQHISIAEFDHFLDQTDELEPLYGLFDEDEFDDIKYVALEFIDQLEQDGCICLRYDYDDSIDINCFAILLLYKVLSKRNFKLVISYT